MPRHYTRFSRRVFGERDAASGRFELYVDADACVCGMFVKSCLEALRFIA